MAGLGLPTLLSLAFSAGVATFFAPCAFPLVPGYLSYFLGYTVAESSDTDATSQDAGRLVSRVQRPIGRALLVSVLAGLGMLSVYVTIACISVLVGAGALTDIAVLELAVGSVFVVGGGAMAGGWTIEGHLVRLPERRRSVLGFFAFGALYAIAAAGCTAPVFVPIILRGITLGPAAGIGVALVYAVGMSLVMAAVTTASALGGTAVASRLAAHTGTIYRAAGVLLLLSGVAEIYYYFYGLPEIIPV